MSKKEALNLHKKLSGKFSLKPKAKINKKNLGLLYTPGVAEPCMEIFKNKKKVYDYTIKSNSVAVVTDGSSVLGLGNIGAEAALPVMEGKAILFKNFADIDAFPICLQTQDQNDIVETVRNIAPVFGGVNLEDISAPKCFFIEEQLQDLGIPVMHDDQHGTAIVVLAALINACKVVGRRFEDLKVVVNGAGAAGTAVAKFLLCHDQHTKLCKSVSEVIVCDSKGILYRGRKELPHHKLELAALTNKYNKKGSLKDALDGMDVFIGVSTGNVLTKEMVRTMARDPIIFALSNPIPEIMPNEAIKAVRFHKTISPSSLRKHQRAVVLPTLPAPTIVIFFLIFKKITLNKYI